MLGPNNCLKTKTFYRQLVVKEHVVGFGAETLLLFLFRTETKGEVSGDDLGEEWEEDEADL